MRLVHVAAHQYQYKFVLPPLASRAERAMSLRYTSFADVLPREEMVQDGRRLSTGGVLSGALHTLGYVRVRALSIP